MNDPLATRRSRLRYRAWHRGTKEADLMIGRFCDRHVGALDAREIDWFERLLAETDVDIMAWAIGTAEAPAAFRGPLLDALRRLDFMADEA